MNKQMKELDDILTGKIPYNFSGFGSGVANRKHNKFTWNDLEFLNANILDFDTAVIVTSYHGQLGWLKATLRSYRDSDSYVIMSYDNPVYIWNNIESTDFQTRFFPRAIHYQLAHSVVVKHKTYDADKRTGWFWDVWYAQGILRNMPNIKYVYITNGDCIIDRPEGMKELPSILGDGDLMSGQSEKGKTIHTADMFMKIEAFNKIFDYMTSRMKCCVFGSQSAECLLRDAVDTLGLKETFVDQPIKKDGSIDFYGQEDCDSTWKKVLGFRNLYHRFEYFENNGLEPIGFKEVMDSYQNWIYWRDGWQRTIFKYWETGDRRYLMQFWDEGKESDYERKFLPLEAYGDKPIWE